MTCWKQRCNILCGGNRFCCCGCWYIQQTLHNPRFWIMCNISHYLGQVMPLIPQYRLFTVPIMRNDNVTCNQESARFKTLRWINSLIRRSSCAQPTLSSRLPFHSCGTLFTHSPPPSRPGQTMQQITRRTQLITATPAPDIWLNEHGCLKITLTIIVTKTHGQMTMLRTRMLMMSMMMTATMMCCGRRCGTWERHAQSVNYWTPCTFTVLSCKASLSCLCVFQGTSVFEDKWGWQTIEVAPSCCKSLYTSSGIRKKMTGLRKLAGC